MVVEVQLPEGPHYLVQPRHILGAGRCPCVPRQQQHLRRRPPIDLYHQLDSPDEVSAPGHQQLDQSTLHIIERHSARPNP